MKIYPFLLEVRSTMGMWARLDCGSEPFSEAVPSPSAARGLVESICWIKGVQTEICGTGICFRPTYASYTFNSKAGSRKSEQLSKDNACQIRATCLVDPVYQILGFFVNKVTGQENLAHSNQAQLGRSLKRGVSYHTPVMGWKDFPLNYYGRVVTPIVPLNLKIPVMSSMVYGDKVTVAHKPAEIRDGVIQYGEFGVQNEQGQLRFTDSHLNQMLEKFVRYLSPKQEVVSC